MLTFLFFMMLDMATGPFSLVLLKDTTLSSDHGLHMAPEPTAAVPDVVLAHGSPLPLDKGLQAVHTVVGDTAGPLLNVVPDTDVQGVQVGGSWLARSLWTKTPWTPINTPDRQGCH